MSRLLTLARLIRPIARRTLSTTARDIFIPQLATSFPYRWLRDACQCPRCVHPSTLQKLHRTSDISPDTRPAQVNLTPQELRITWADSTHESVFPLAWLQIYASPASRTAFHMELPRSAWTVSKLSRTPSLFVDYTAIRGTSPDTAVLLATLTQLLQYGIVFVRGVPTDVTDARTCELRSLAGTLGRIRDTFYGEIWDVRNVANSTNIAYTNLDLGLHMDLQYFEHPPRFQILHCLRNRVHGGSSLFVDALHAAQTLRAQDPIAFATLVHTRVPYHYVNAGHHLHHAHPVISLAPHAAPTDSDSDLDAPLASSSAPINHISYSPPFQAPLPPSTPSAFYAALARFAALLDAPGVAFEYLLREGDAVVFDNRRVLHARRAFTETGEAGEGETSRWLHGCYLEADDPLDRYRKLRSSVGA